MKSFVIWFFLISSKALFADSAICVFCNPRILETQSVFESEHFRVLVDYEPLVKGHLLVIPKRHMVKAHEMLSEEWKDLSTVMPKVIRVFSEYLDTDNYIILEKNGRDAFQDIPHVHFHLFPVTSQKWSQIFSILSRKQLRNSALEKEVSLFRNYFSKQ